MFLKAVVNEDTQGNVNQLQAEIKKLKEQLAQLTSVPSVRDVSVSGGKSWAERGEKSLLL